jgi:NADPH-dependent curcumin reductase CurA
MLSNNAVILLKGQTYGEIKKGEALDFVKRPYEFDKLEDGDIVVQTMYLSSDPYLVLPRSSTLT